MAKAAGAHLMMTAPVEEMMVTQALDTAVEPAVLEEASSTSMVSTNA